MIDPKKFLDTAELLIQKGTCEADFRSSASRSYYAIYHTVKDRFFGCGEKDKLQKLTGSSGKKIAHQTLMNIFDHCDDGDNDDLEGIGFKFKNLLSDRVLADYHLHKSFSKTKAEDLFEDAQDICERLRAVENSELCAPIIRWYEKLHSK